MNHVLDLRNRKGEVRGDGWLAAWILAAVLIVAGLVYFHYLDSGCKVNGIITWGGKSCIN